MQIEILQDLHTKRYAGAEPPWLNDGRRYPMWELIRDFGVAIDGEEHWVPASFVFNGSSIPWLLWWLYPPSFPPAWRGSCLHDMGVGMAWKDKPQDYWDRALAAMILHDGGRQKDADRFYWAVSRAPRGAYAALAEESRLW